MMLREGVGGGGGGGLLSLVEVPAVSPGEGLSPECKKSEEREEVVTLTHLANN